MTDNELSAAQREADEAFMRRALDLAKNGCGWTNPNPMVGAVIVRDGRIIGEGWHTKSGKLHAEREAFAHCSEDPAGATLYVTLEPCCHWGKTPPCTEAIIERGIARVVMGAPDPNPLVAGRGMAQLRQAGIEVTEGILVPECQHANRVFLHYIQTNKPYVVLKYAMTLDGKIATKTGASRWVTGKAAREHVHACRHRFAAILVGINTVVADDPLLTCRLDGEALLGEPLHTPSTFFEADELEGTAHQPVRVVLDSTLRIPTSAQLVKTAQEIPTIIATTSTDPERTAALTAAGCTVLVTKAKGAGRIDLANLLDQLGQRGIDSLYVEGGATVHAAYLEAGLVDEVHAYVAPKIFGGASAPGPVAGTGVEAPSQAVTFACASIKQLGPDVLLECEVV